MLRAGIPADEQQGNADDQRSIRRQRWYVRLRARLHKLLCGTHLHVGKDKQRHAEG